MRACLLCICGCASQGDTGDSAETDLPEEPDYTHYYTNLQGENFSFSIEENDAVVYEKLPSELIEEWSDNVALAEKTYCQDNVYIVVEGYIDSINKNEFDNDDYYIKIVDNADDWNFLGTDSVEIYFREQREYEALLNYKTGDYITALCAAVETTTVMEYPRLDAKLVLETVSLAEAAGIEADELSLFDHVGQTVQDIEYFYGKDYVVGFDENVDSIYFSYSDSENVPYIFYTNSSLMDDLAVKKDDLIMGVDTWQDGAKITGSAVIGGPLKTLQDELAEENAEIIISGNDADSNLPKAMLSYTIINQSNEEEVYDVTFLTDEAEENVVYVGIFSHEDW